MRVERLDIENYEAHEGWISMDLYGIIWGLGFRVLYVSFLPTPLGSAEP